MPTSPIMQRNNLFTLIELVAVMAIISIATGLAVSTFRDESPIRKLQRACLEFEAFATGIRYQAMESGEERIISLDPEGNRLAVTTPLTEEEKAEDAGDILPENIRTFWKFPEGISLEQENLSDGELLELFRFFPDGGASGTLELIFKYRSLERHYTISPLTGRLLLQEVEK